MVDPPLRTVLRVLVGSHAYGMSTRDSDHDYLEVFLEPNRAPDSAQTPLPL